MLRPPQHEPGTTGEAAAPTTSRIQQGSTGAAPMTLTKTAGRSQGTAELELAGVGVALRSIPIARAIGEAAL